MTQNTQDQIKKVCDDVKELLLQKNAKYGDSALNPKRVFSKADAVEQIKVRIDDKLSRIATTGFSAIDEDTLQDLIGYLVLLKIALERQEGSSPYEDVLRPTGCVRVYELARELGLSNREVLEACDSLGITVKGHSSSLCAAAASKLRGFLNNRGAQYEDVLEDYAAWTSPYDHIQYYGQSTENDAWPEDDLTESNDGILGAAGTDDLPFAHEEWTVWDEFDAWDPSVGPIEPTLTQAEVDEVLSRKALHQFSHNEIVATIDKRGLILGVKKDGSTCELGSNGQCK